MKLANSYTDKFNLMCAFEALHPQKVSIVKYLFGMPSFTGTYTELTEAIGQKKPNVTNIRKAMKELEKMGVVYIVYREDAEFDDDGNLIGSAPMKACFLQADWMDQLLKWYKSIFW